MDISSIHHRPRTNKQCPASASGNATNGDDATGNAKCDGWVGWSRWVQCRFDGRNAKPQAVCWFSKMVQQAMKLDSQGDKWQSKRGKSKAWSPNNPLVSAFLINLATGSPSGSKSV